MQLNQRQMKIYLKLVENEKSNNEKRNVNDHKSHHNCKVEYTEVQHLYTCTSLNTREVLCSHT